MKNSRDTTLRVDRGELADDVVLEAGDVIWCAAALSSNAGADIDAGMRTVLFEYLRGTQHIRNMTAEKPRWRDAAALLAVKYEQLSFGDLDMLIRAGFEPLSSPLMNIYDPDVDEFTIDGHITMGVVLIHAMSNLHLQQYAYGDNLDGDPSPTVMPEKFKELGLHIAKYASSTLLETLFIVNRLLPDVTMAEIVKKNIDKISTRVKTGSVDKSDIQRQEAGHSQE